MIASYIGDVGTIILVDCGVVITGAENTKLKVRKPNGTEVAWNASVYQTQYLKYTTQIGDLSMSGTYLLQASLTLGGWSGLGQTATFIVKRTFD